MKTPLCVAAVFVLLLGEVWCVFRFKPKNCNILRPDGISVQQQSGTPPFKISASKATYRPGEALTVTVASTDFTRPFLNAMIKTQCMMCDTHGVFSEDGTTSRTFNCGGETDSSIVATSNAATLTYKVKWTPSANVPDSLSFVATVVEDDTVWWADIESPSLTKAADPTTTESVPSSTKAETTTAQPTEPTQSHTGQVGTCSGTDRHFASVIFFACAQLCLLLGMPLL